jgi:hypothetical protein
MVLSCTHQVQSEGRRDSRQNSPVANFRSQLFQQEAQKRRAFSALSWTAD